ncbi:hypothetical protein CHGG_07341 [Chaetomium globosum CBS 148.51]|uniref:Ribosomal protein bL31m N-terminal domain-containing protein n=1 Tax=Chaetomium globosum (strain ATCC 6205 / CBS 148.51 / DSM 1962 / NBRC 6347 / NRRL 1970) TaxID=306901 RepID=Q2GXG3_CHAGB|nr:uncharacterized protein CHGG_07341 [Chaetomium globosum CBS 148.51]EAQ86088.1 hypothetical protein CHGG_07341 [Chaetomium globosum CBS 148.51]
MGKLPSTLLRRPSLAGYLPSTAPTLPHTPTAATRTSQTTTTITTAAAAGQVRHATFVPRSRRPYQFTQLVQLSDGSTFTVRTTSPLALYKSAKDSRNHILWQPTEKSLRNVEVDEAGKLAAFRERYGSSWDLDGPAAPAAAAGGAAAAPAAAAPAAADGSKEAAAQAPAEAAAPAEDPFDSLVDLISTYATEDKNIKGGLSAKDQARKEKKKK